MSERDEVVKRIKELRKERRGQAIAEQRENLNLHHGEMIGYYKVLELLCPNPHED